MTTDTVPTDRVEPRRVGDYCIAVGQQTLFGSKITMTPGGRVFDGTHRAMAFMQMYGAIPESLIAWVDEHGRPTAAPWEQ